MIIDITLKRIALREILDKGRPYSQLKELDGVELLDLGSNNFDCVDFALKCYFGADWNLYTADMSDKFLETKGFKRTWSPENGDLVAYQNLRNGVFWKTTTTCHWGIFEDEKVISKFGYSGPVLLHNLEMVEPAYGNQIIFYKKVEE